MSAPILSMVKRQRDWSAGEIDSHAERRDDRPEFKNGVRYARNVNTGNEAWLGRRAGRSVLYVDEGVRDEFRPFPDRNFSITFADGRFTARLPNGIVHKELVAPWTADMVPLLRWVLAIDTIIVCGPSPLRPQVIFYDRDLDDWAISDYEFETAANDTEKAPFYRFGQRGVTMQPGALTGATTITFSADVLDPAHVGVLFRYVGKQVRIDTVNSAVNANVTVLEDLYPTKELTVASVEGFTKGEIVESVTSSFRGEIIAIGTSPAKLTVVTMKNSTALATSEKLVGPNASTTISAISDVTPGATIQWDEQFMSDFRGWPQSVSQDVQRVIFNRFPLAKNFILWTAISAPFDCAIGAAADAAILEYIPRECEVLHVVGGYDEFALTDQGAYYIPISPGSPLQPGSVEFRLIFQGSIANVQPLQVTEGLLFVDGSRSRIHAITATGQVARPYVADDISRFHQHLFSDVSGLAATNNDPQIAGRQMYVLNGDGTVVVGRYWSDRDYVGWYKWDGTGAVHSISSRYEDVIFSTDYSPEGGTVSVAEKLDATTLLDCTFRLSEDGGFDVLEMSDGTAFLFADGTPLHLSSYALSAFAGSTVQVISGGFYYGDIVVGENGELPFPVGVDEVLAGFKFDVIVDPLIEDFESGESVGQRLRRRKISKVMVRVKDTQQFDIDGRQYGGYRVGDDMGDPVPARTDTYTYRQIGRSHDPGYRISQTIPGGFKLLETTTEVTV